MSDTMTQDELQAEATKRFGPDPRDWAFVCPACGDITTGADMAQALAAHPRTNKTGDHVTASDILGQECIGRTLGVLSGPAKDWRGRGCDWVAYGLFRGPVIVTLPDGRTMGAFRLAEKAGA